MYQGKDTGVVIASEAKRSRSWIASSNTPRNDGLNLAMTSGEGWIKNALQSSFPRRRESIWRWIPAFAGMTEKWIKNTFIYDFFGKRSFAQCGEDLIALELLKDIKRGTYLEIGAYHPKVFSNTYLFYKKGWRGMVVEPNERMKSLFKQSRAEDRLVISGIRGQGSGDRGDYYVFEEETRNTFSKEMAEKYQRAGYRVQRTEKKKTIQLSEVLKKRVDLLSIDTEGLDEEIVKSLVKLKIRPKVIIVEGEGAGRVLEEIGYTQVGRTPYSLIYRFVIPTGVYSRSGGIS